MTRRVIGDLIRTIRSSSEVSVSSFRPSFYEEIYTNQHPPTFANNVHDHDDEETNLRITSPARPSLAYQEPHPGHRDSKSFSIPRNLGGETVNTEEISCRILSEPLLFHFSVASAVSLPITAPGFTSD